jgi:UMF1 family MFS transporter
VSQHRGRASTLGLVSWALYDWANSAYFAVIQTFVFAAYFTRKVAVDETAGTAQWAYAVTVGGVLVAIGGPMLGAITDQSGRRKPWLAAFTGVCIAATALLWFVKPSPAYVTLALVLVAVASAGAQYASIFYNAMLPGLATPERIGRWSGWGWGLGYTGGVACLGLALLGFLGSDATQPPPADATHVRATFLLVAAWYLVFSMPLFLFTPDTPRTGKPWRQATRDGLRQLVRSFAEVRANLPVFRFMIAWMFCADGLATMFTFGGVFASGTFDMTEAEVVRFGIAMNLVAGLGAAAFARVDDWLGGKRTIVVALAGLIVAGASMLAARTQTVFWAFGLALGIFVGPAQAASRSYLSRMAPESLQAQMFGVYALAGKATAFLGPLAVAAITQATGSQRLGLGTVIVFFTIGLLLMSRVPGDKNA